jgi:hypothetical protein
VAFCKLQEAQRTLHTAKEKKTDTQQYFAAIGVTTAEKQRAVLALDGHQKKHGCRITVSS